MYVVFCDSFIEKEHQQCQRQLNQNPIVATVVRYLIKNLYPCARLAEYTFAVYAERDTVTSIAEVTVKEIVSVAEPLVNLMLEDFKLYCISKDEFTDAQIAILMERVVLESIEEVADLCIILERHRPKLNKRIISRIKG